MADGGKCPVPASHQWGTVNFCCTHFDQFVTGLLDLKEAVNERRHLDIIEEYNRRTKRPSQIPGSHCDAEKKK
jgi:hypothetical protein